MPHISPRATEQASLLQPLLHLWQRLVVCLRNGLLILVLAGLAGGLAACAANNGLGTSMTDPYWDEREELFRARVLSSGSIWQTMDLWGYSELLNDTERFYRFLTDDEFARDQISRLYDKPYLVHLGPAYTGATPGTGS